ncbi:MAG: transposase [Spirochaeta sp.]|nr:transposase [Spirochaeta sp.]
MEALQELFTAYQNGSLPKEHGYIVSVFYHNSTTYTRYELIAFNNVKDIYMTEEGLIFQAEGRKVYVLVEPAGYPNSHTEPAYRTDSDRIPYRKKELIDFVTRRQDHVYIGDEPVVSYTSFTVLKSVGQDVSYVFFPHENITESILEFFRVSLWKQARVPQTDARKVKDQIAGVLKKIQIGDEYL